MVFYLTFNPSWFVLLAIGMTIFVALFVYRKSYAKKYEIKQQIVFTVIVVLLSLLTELLGVSMNLWNYTDGNWPAILWIIYFFSGMAGYQVIKFVTEKVR